MHSPPWRRPGGAIVVMLGVASSAQAQSGSTTVLGTDNIYYAGGNTSGPDRTAPTAIALTATTNRILSFASITGTWSCVNGSGFSADGLDAIGGVCLGGVLNASATGGLSGVNTPGRNMTLLGVFVSSATPSAPAPSALSYAGANAYTQSSYSGIGLNQVFVIGDGRTTDVLGNAAQSGSVQQFLVPDNATRLFLGMADVCGFSGSPSCFSDNGGSLSVSYSITGDPIVQPPTPGTTVPEPSTYALMAAGLAGMAVLRRRAKAA